MMTIGDVLAAVAILLGIGVTGWATLVAIALGAPAAVLKARRRIEAGAGETALLGILYLLVPLAGLAVMNVPNPLVKLVGLGIVGASLVVAGVGVAGVASILSNRIAGGSELSPYASVVKASAFVAAAVQLPGLGWFFVLPALLLVGLGSGFPALLRWGKAARVPQEAP